MAFIKKVLPFKLLCLSLWACNDPFVPKPLAYPQITFPKKEYTSFQNPHFVYSFQIPHYASCIQDADYTPNENKNKQWLNVQMPLFNATIYLTYKNIQHDRLDKIIFDSYKFTSKQIYKATDIQDSPISSPQGYKMVLYTVRGDAATTHQFFATDNKKHFLRGSLYLNCTPKEDSLKIITDFIKPDIIHLMKTLSFKP